MRSVNSVSGGQTSAYIEVNYPADYSVFSVVCLDDVRCKVKDPLVLKYAQDKLQSYNDRYGEFIATAEDDLTLKAMMNLEQFTGRKIDWVRGVSFDSLISDGSHTRLPSWARRYCTQHMKLQAIFEWWFLNIGEKVKMRIGFRSDEFDRMIRFFNNSNPTKYSIPVSCSTRGERRQRHQEFDWRFVEMPLIKDNIEKMHVKEFWKGKKIEGDLFNEEIPIEFPAISNCVFCFHKQKETLAVESILNPEKMQWASEKESFTKNGKSMGFWLDDRTSYQEIIDNAKSIHKERFFEMNVLGETCDSGGCTD